jgi:hypothetical protein
VVLFERLVADGTPETLERAAALYRGPFLQGFVECGEEFDAGARGACRHRGGR